MSRTRRFLNVVIGGSLFGAVCATPICALAIPITATETLFSFDFTAKSPLPPYTNIQFGAVFSNSNPINVGVDSMLTNVYGGLNGANLVQARNDTLPGFAFDTAFNDDGTVYGPLTTANPIFAPMLDGTFSFGLQMISGSAELVSFTACGLTNGVVGPCQTFPVPSQIPEPSSLLLLPLGFVAAKFVRRHSRTASVG
jgi:hypothetical protein